jgi:hypothetical protein
LRSFDVKELGTFDTGHELLRDTGPVPFTIIFDFSKHFNLPIGLPAAQRYVAYGFGFRILCYGSVQGSFKGLKREVFLSSFGFAVKNILGEFATEW